MFLMHWAYSGSKGVPSGFRTSWNQIEGTGSPCLDPQG